MMINIIHVEMHYDDKRAITALEVKLKSFPNGTAATTGHPLVATVSAAFFRTTLLADVGASLKTTLNEKRRNVVDLLIAFKKSSKLTTVDIANFIDALQKAVDETVIF